MNTSAQFYTLARSWMQLARKERRKGHDANVRALVRAARDAIRSGRTWQHILEHEPRDPWPEAELAMVARIQPYSTRINLTP